MFKNKNILPSANGYIRPFCFILFNQVHISLHSLGSYLKNTNWIILEFIWKNSDTFRELIKIILVYTLFVRVHIKNSETFIECYKETLSFFVRVHIKQNWNIWIVATKQYYTHFSVHTTQYIARELLFNNTAHSVRIKQNWHLPPKPRQYIASLLKNDTFL